MSVFILQLLASVTAEKKKEWSAWRKSPSYSGHLATKTQDQSWLIGLNAMSIKV